MALSLSFRWSNFPISAIAWGFLITVECEGCGCGWYWGPSKVLCRGISPTVFPSVAYPRQGSKSTRLCGAFHVSPHGLRDMYMMRLSALNEHGSGVIDIIIGNVCHIGWCIVGRQAIWWEGMVVLNLRIMGAARTSQIFAYHIWGWMIHLVKARWGHQVHLSNILGSGNCNRIGFMLTMASIIVAICIFMASMSAFICSCASSTSPIALALAQVR